MPAARKSDLGRELRESARASYQPAGGEHRNDCDSDEKGTQHRQELPGHAEAVAPPQQAKP
ncbi:MAG: hypothetical protein PVS3B2_08380 [Candidatus Dormibacteraceae bacterium]